MAPVVLVGALGCPWSNAGEEAEEGEGVQSERGGVRGGQGCRGGDQAVEGGGTQAGRSQRGSPAIGHAAASPPGRRKKTVLPLVGRAGFGQ